MLAFRYLVAALAALATAGFASAQMALDEQADTILNAARRAFSDKNYPAAATQFRAFVQRFGKHKDQLAARYGLALCHLEGPEKDYQAALKELKTLAGNRDFSERPFVHYYQGQAWRGLGQRELARSVAGPNAGLHHAAHQHFEEAGKSFIEAVSAFSSRASARPAAGELPLDVEWACRSRCDAAEMFQRVGKFKEAKAVIAPLVDDPALARSRYHGLGQYYHGFACFLEKDYAAARRSLLALTPFADPIFGTHACYLVARLHHLAHERQEALENYLRVGADYDKLKHAAAAELRQPDRIQDPEQKRRLQALVQGDAPDHVTRAVFFLSELHFENGEFAEALAGFTAFTRDFPASALAAQATLEQGCCHVQLKMWADAQKVLQPLAEKDPRLADQCLLWLGKAQVGAADLANAVETFRKAAQAAAPAKAMPAKAVKQLITADPQARLRRGECLWELAGALELAGNPRSAAATYEEIVRDKLLPDREDEAQHNLTVAFRLAGDHASCESACEQFLARYPRSPLLPAVLLRHAENADFLMQAAAKAEKAAEDNRLAALQRPAFRKGAARQKIVMANKITVASMANNHRRHLDDMEKRYRILVEKYPDSPRANLARYGLAVVLHRKGEYAKALECLETIPAAARVDDLAAVGYLATDCQIRLAPAKSGNAEAHARAEESLKKAIGQMEAFVVSAPSHPQAADALMDLGYCHQRLAALESQRQERIQHLAAARTAYEQLLQRFHRSEQQPLAMFERGKILALAQDVDGAIIDLNRFTQDPLRTTTVAPSAVVLLATLLRSQGKSQEAAAALWECRKQHESGLAVNPATSHLVPLLQYHHGLALGEAGREEEAHGILDGLARNFPNAPEAPDAALRSGQCLKIAALKKIADGRMRAAIPNLSLPDILNAQQTIDAGQAELRGAVTYFAEAARVVRQHLPANEARARLLYEAARTCRLFIEPEIDAARARIKQELMQKQRQELARMAKQQAIRKRQPGKPVAKVRQPAVPPQQPPASVPAPEVPLAQVPLQNAEREARGYYKTLLDSVPELALQLDARFELAQMLGERNEYDAAIKLLREGMEQKPSAQLADRIRVRLGAAYLAKGDGKQALQILSRVAGNRASLLNAEATYEIGECHLFLGEPVEAVKHFSIFRDQAPFQNLAGTTDRALLRLGHAQAKQEQWEKSRQALETLATRFPSSPWVADAHYATAWTYLRQGQYDHAAHAFQQVVATGATELAARAQLGLGVCLMAQKRFGDAGTAFLVVPCTSDYPNVNAVALLEAARACSANNQETAGVRLLERVINSHPNSVHAEAARKRLAELK